MKRRYLTLILAGLLILDGVGLALAPNPNPGVIPNHGRKYGRLSAEWWQWAFSFPAADVPFLNTGGPVDISAHQSGHVWFLAGANNGLTEPRTGEVPAGTFPVPPAGQPGQRLSVPARVRIRASSRRDVGGLSPEDRK